MPKDFNRCVRKGGRVRTVKIGRDRYRYVCYDNEGSHAGHVHKKGEKRGRSRNSKKGS